MNRAQRRVFMEKEKRSFESFFKKTHPEWPESGFKTTASVDGFEYANVYVRGVWRGWWGNSLRHVDGW